MEELRKGFFGKVLTVCREGWHLRTTPEEMWEEVEKLLTSKDARINSLLDVIAKNEQLIEIHIPAEEDITEEMLSKPKRQYPADVPNPETQPEEFNEYLRKNNEVIEETAYWIVIKNSYIENQLVMFSTVRGVGTIQDFHPKSQPAIDMLAILSKYSGKHIYINANKEKSIPNRLHIHIKL